MERALLYKSSPPPSREATTTAPWVICGPGENAGVIDIGDGQAAIFKMESSQPPQLHRALSGRGDTAWAASCVTFFTMGARPVANMNALRFVGTDHPKMKHLISGVVRGIGELRQLRGGVPTVGGEVNFDKAYDGNILVNAMTVGVADTDKIFLFGRVGRRQSDRLCRLQDRRDGIHGANNGERRLR